MKYKKMKLLAMLLAPAALAGCGTMNTSTPVPGNYSINSGTYSVSNEEVQADIKYPIIAELPDLTVKEAVSAMFKADVDEMVKEANKGVGEVKKRRKDEGFTGAYNYNIEFKTHLSRATLLSLTTDEYKFLGGAHGMNHRKSFNLDMITGKRLNLAALFKEGFDYKNFINAWVQKEIDKKPGDYFSKAAGGFKSIQDDQSFYLTAQSLVIIFQQYEIACYAAGLIEIEIPLGVIRNKMNISM